MTELAKKDTLFINKLKTKLAETEKLNEGFNGQVEILNERIKALSEEKERLHLTGEIHAEEAKRLSDGQGEIRMQADKTQFLNFQERVNGL